MARDILFRGMAKKNGEWVYGDLCHSRSGKPFIRYWHGAPGKEVYRAEEVERNSVGQFSGMVDKNERKIYEGDIVLKRTYNGKKEFPVTFSGGMFHCGFGGGSSTPTHRYTLEDKQIEVVGNIFDNPELLEVTNG